VVAADAAADATARTVVAAERGSGGNEGSGGNRRSGGNSSG
jgi:hypothetical protein